MRLRLKYDLKGHNSELGFPNLRLLGASTSLLITAAARNCLSVCLKLGFSRGVDVNNLVLPLDLFALYAGGV